MCNMDLGREWVSHIINAGVVGGGGLVVETLRGSDDGG